METSQNQGVFFTQVTFLLWVGILLHLITRDQAEGEASWQKKGKPRVEGQPFSALPGKWPATAHVEEL